MWEWLKNCTLLKSVKNEDKMKKIYIRWGKDSKNEKISTAVLCVK